MAAVICLSAFSCAPSKKKAFQDEANAFFEQYKGTFSGSEKIYEYSESGSFYINKPVTKDEAFDKKLTEFCQNAKDEFLKSAKSAQDTLFIASKTYNPGQDIFGTELIVQKTLSRNVSNEYYYFNSKEFSKDLSFNALVNAKRTLTSDKSKMKKADIKKLKSSKNAQLLYTDTGIDVIYNAGDILPASDGEVRISVPYGELYPVLPDAIKENTEQPERTIDTTKKLVALTFDDGPHSKYTAQILDTLEKYGQVATFFDVGNRVADNAEVTIRAKAMGCEVAGHSWSHANLQTSSKEKIEQEIEKADSALEAVLGEKPYMMRPPYGAVGKTLLSVSDEYLIGWSVDTLDWKSRDAEKVIASVKSERTLDGDVILMHAIYKSTADAVDKLVPWLINNGYQLVTVSELINYKYNDILETGKYYDANYFNGKAKPDYN